MKSLRPVAFGLLCFTFLFCLNSQAADDQNIIRVTTTTTTTNTGLMHKLKSAFEADTGRGIKIETYGSGRALRSARDGNADVIIVHAPTSEEKFMQAGYGLSRHPLMKNEFIIAGPEDDPAGIAHVDDAITAFKTIAEKESRFVSRGDDSGTHKKELELWALAHIEPYGKWYIEYGFGMGKTLSYANSKQAYVLVDRGTWLAKRGTVDLVQLFYGDALLDNPYHIITVNPDKYPSVNQEGAQHFIRWITSSRGQKIIRDLVVDGEHLFTPVDAL